MVYVQSVQKNYMAMKIGIKNEKEKIQVSYASVIEGFVFPRFKLICYKTDWMGRRTRPFFLLHLAADFVEISKIPIRPHSKLRVIK